MTDLWRKCGGYGGYLADNPLANLTANWLGLATCTTKRTMNKNLSNQIQLFKPVFKRREDVFSVRWEKENKSGYMPAYFYDPYKQPTIKSRDFCEGENYE